MPEMLTTIQHYPLEKRKILKKTIGAILAWLLLYIIIFVPAHIFLWKDYSKSLIVIDIIFILILIIEPIYQYMYYKKYFYDVRTDFLAIKKGVIMPREAILNYEKIQDVYMDQDLLDRIFSLWDVHVSTATLMSGREAHIDGVNHDNAIAIRELILSKIKKVRKNKQNE